MKAKKNAVTQHQPVAVQTPFSFKRAALAVAISSAFAFSGMQAAHATTFTVSGPVTATPAGPLSIIPSDTTPPSGTSIIVNDDIDGSAVGEIANDAVIVTPTGSITITNTDNHGVLISVLSRVEKAKVVTHSFSSTPSAVGALASSFDIDLLSRARVLNNAVTNNGSISVTQNTSDSITGVRISAEAQEASGTDLGAALTITSAATNSQTATSAPYDSTGSTNIGVIVGSVRLEHWADSLVQNNAVTNNNSRRTLVPSALVV